MIGDDEEGKRVEEDWGGRETIGAYDAKLRLDGEIVGGTKVCLGIVLGGLLLLLSLFKIGLFGFRAQVWSS